MSGESPAATAPSLRLQVGGTLVPGRDIYIARPEDEQLFALLSEGEYVNILSSRQVGKSSLMLRAALRLRERGDRFALVDLTSLGTPDDAGAYFRGLVGEIARQLKLTFDAGAFWREDESSRTSSQRFIRFFREVVAAQIKDRVLVFLDEIDSTLKLPFTDDLFTALRAMYNERALVPAYQRITFCLVGVATPDELIKDRRTTPYNVGKTLWVGDFDAARDDLTPLARVLSDDPQHGAEPLRRVLYWTAGHPFLTARLCHDWREEGAAAPDDVDRFVAERYTTLARLGEDVHIQQILRFLRERLTDGFASFDLYERILKGASERDQPSLAHAELKLSGLVKRDRSGMLVPRNRIYERLFDLDWVRKTRPKQEVRRYRRLAFAAAAVLVLGAIGVATYYQTVVVPAAAQLSARKELERLSVALGDDPRGWTEVKLPSQDTLGVLNRALPYLSELAAAPDFSGFALDLSDRPAVDLRPLAELKGLRRLNLMGSKLTDLGPLAKLTGLQALVIAHNPVADLAPLANLVHLRTLDASTTSISDLAPLSGLGRLEGLDVSGTQVGDLTPLARLTNLQQLDVSNTVVSNVAPLAALTRMKELNLSRTEVRDLSPLYGLVHLHTLALDGLGDIPFNPNRIPGLKLLRDPPHRSAGAPYRPGETFRDCPECPQMVVVPAGSFEMGSPPGEAGRYDSEGPQHRVKIAQPFAVGKYEVRFDEWAYCVQDAGCRAVSDEGWGRGPRPVIYVSWDDAQAYVKWLSKKTGEPYRLLSEAEWEYAARGGTTTSRFWGNQPDEACGYASVADRALKQAWSNYPFPIHECSDGFAYTAPGGSFEPNAFGLYDMIGNTWEWVEDCWHDGYQGAPADGSAWTTGGCGLRVLRGGGWGSEPQVARAALRGRVESAVRNVDYGFRVARTLTP